MALSPPSSVEKDPAKTKSSAELPANRWVRLHRIAPLMVGLVVAAGVTGPFPLGGWLLALDWVQGPRSHFVLSSHLSVTGQTSLPLSAVLAVIGTLVGYATLSWLVLFAALVLAAWSAGRLVPSGTVAKTVGATLYTVNPYVFQRIYAGQISVLLAYAVLPLVAKSLVTSADRRRWSGAVWIALDGALTVHFIWVGLVILLAVVLWRHDLRTLGWAAGCLGALVALDAYLVVAYLAEKTTVAVGSTDLAAFRTAGDPHLGLFVNVLGLYGFWRGGPVLPKNLVAAWPVLLAVFLIVAARGAWKSLRIPAQAVLVGPILISGIIGFFLALGTQGPTGSVFRLLFDYLPGFAVMREPEKFSALIVLTYAVLVGIGVDQIVRSFERHRSQVLFGGVALLAVLGYTPNIFYGLGGQIRPSHYPADWAQANAVMGAGQGKILALPLNMYESFSFAGGHDIANPAPQYFSRKVLVGGVVDAGPLVSQSISPEDAYLSELMSLGPKLDDLGHLVAQLGVRYVVLFKTADWFYFTWVEHQSDLRLVYSSPGIDVYRNQAAVPGGARVVQSLGVPNLACYAALSSHADLTGTAVYVDPTASCPTSVPQPPPLPDVRRVSPVSYEVASGPAGYVEIPQPGDGTWTAPGHKPLTLIDGLQAFEVGTGPVHISYRNWQAAAAGDAISAVALIVFAIGAGSEVLLRRRRSPARSSRNEA